MGYVEIIIIGYLFNIVINLFLTVTYITIILMNKTPSTMLNITLIKKLNDIIKLKRKLLISYTVNPYKLETFIFILPFGHGMYSLNEYIKHTASEKSFLDSIINNLKSEDLRLDKLLEKARKVKKDGE